MTAREKAVILMNKFSNVELYIITESRDLVKSIGWCEAAKQCALLAANEMYDVAQECDNIEVICFLTDVIRELEGILD
jgi:hypothetical protein